LFDLGIDGYLLKPVLSQSLTRELLRVYGSPRISNVRSTKPPPTPQLEGLRVLLAEDNIVNQKVAVKMLEILGCSVDVANNGSEALEKWERSDYDLVFMDVHMPLTDGMEGACARSRRARDDRARPSSR
jgi:YesN/AraC family two-component response regulator